MTFNGRLMGDIPDPQFAELMLATFIGTVQPTPRLKRELLGFRDLTLLICRGWNHPVRRP